MTDDDQSTRSGDGAGFVLLEYVDLNGIPRGGFIDENGWDRAVETGVGFGSVIMDFAESHNGRSMAGAPSLGPATGEIQVVADPDTSVPIPWLEHEPQKAICRIFRRGEPSPLCSRTTLETVLERFEGRPYEPVVGADIEFTLFNGWEPEELERGGTRYLKEAAVTGGRPYWSQSVTEHAGFFGDVRDAMEQMHHGIEGIHKESSRGLFEGILPHAGPIEQADAIIAFRTALRGVGADYGLQASFMPRPFDDYEGGSQHYHFSFSDGEENAFAVDSDAHGLSDLAYHFIGGVMEHADGLTALCAPTVNSYKRLRPGLWAPVDRSYGFDNKTCLVRVPPERDDRTRVEFRLPDSTANPYLSLAGVLAAGLDGVDAGIDPGDAVEGNVFRMDRPADRRLPTSLPEALQALEGDSCLVDALGERLVEQFVRIKRDEVDRFQAHVTDWEAREYADRY